MDWGVDKPPTPLYLDKVLSVSGSVEGEVTRG